MNMMNKCAKFHKDSPSGKKSSIQSPERDWTFGDGWFCVQLCLKFLQVTSPDHAHSNWRLNFLFLDRNPDRRPCHWRRVLMILQNRCHGILPWNRLTVRVQSEMLSSSCRRGGSFFIAHAWRLNVCLWVTTLVSLTPAKYCRFSFQTRLDMMLRWNSQPDEWYSWPRWRLQMEALAYQDTVLTLHKQRMWRTLLLFYCNFKKSNWLVF